MQRELRMRCIRWVVLVAIGSLAGGCLSMIIPEHHPGEDADMAMSMGAGTSGTGGDGATTAAGGDLGGTDGGGP